MWLISTDHITNVRIIENYCNSCCFQKEKMKLSQHLNLSYFCLFLVPLSHTIKQIVLFVSDICMQHCENKGMEPFAVQSPPVILNRLTGLYCNTIICFFSCIMDCLHISHDASGGYYDYVRWNKLQNTIQLSWKSWILTCNQETWCDWHKRSLEDLVYNLLQIYWSYCIWNNSVIPYMHT